MFRNNKNKTRANNYVNVSKPRFMGLSNIDQMQIKCFNHKASLSKSKEYNCVSDEIFKIQHI